MSKIFVKQLFIVEWQGILTHTGWKSWQELLQSTEKLNIELIFLGKEKVILDQIELIPTDKICKKNKLSYTQVSLKWNGANKPFTTANYKI